MTHHSVTQFSKDPGPAGWNEILPAWKQLAPLEGNQTADWLIIGAGFAGLSAAKRLRELHPNDRISVVDARMVAEGPAGRNSGFMIDLPHNLASHDYAGAFEKDKAQIEMNRAAIAFASKISSEYDLSPEAFILSGKTNAAASPKGLRHNADYADHLKKLGETFEFFDAVQMKSLSGSDYYQGGLFTPGTAMLQPALYIREFAQGLLREGVNIYEQSPIQNLSKVGKVWRGETSKGSIEAPKVILAVNGRVENFGFFKKRLMHIYLYASMTPSLSRSEIKSLGGEKRWGFTPADPMGSTVRKTFDGEKSRLIIRNGITWSPNFKVDKSQFQTIAQKHDETFAARFPLLKDIKMEHRWGGLICLSRNNVSAFGEVEEGLYSACCQNGLGTAKGTLNGVLAAELASGIPSDFLDATLSEDEPKRLPFEPFLSLGAKTYMRVQEYRAGREL